MRVDAQSNCQYRQDVKQHDAEKRGLDSTEYALPRVCRLAGSNGHKLDPAKRVERVYKRLCKPGKAADESLAVEEVGEPLCMTVSRAKGRRGHVRVLGDP